MGAVLRLATHSADPAADERLLEVAAKETPDIGLSAFAKALRDRRLRRGKPPGVLDVLHSLDSHFPADELYDLYAEGLGGIPALLSEFQMVDLGHWNVKNWRLCEMLSTEPPVTAVTQSARNRLKRLARIPECLLADFEPATAFGFATLGYGLYKGPYAGRKVDDLPSHEERMRRALDSLNRAVELDSDLPEARLWRAHVLLAMGYTDAALEDANRAVRLLPDSSEAYATRARCHRVLGNDAQAAEDETIRDKLRTAERVAWVRSPEGRKNLLFRASTHIRASLQNRAQGRDEDARQQASSALSVYDELVRCSPEDPMLRLGRALLNLQLEQWPALIADATSLLQSVPDAAYAYRLRARARRSLGQDCSADDAAYRHALEAVKLPVDAELPTDVATVDRPQCELTLEEVKRLAAHPSPQSAVRLSQALIASDTSKQIWEEACQTLKGFPGKALRAALPQLHTYVVKCAGPALPSVEEPVALLGRLEDPASVDYLLIGLLRDSEATRAISHRAAVTLAELPADLAVPALKKALIVGFARDNDWVLARAVTALNDIDPDIGRQFFAEFLLKGTRAQQERAAELLSLQVQAVSALVLAEIVTDSRTERTVGEKAAAALGRPYIAGSELTAWARAQVERGVGP